MQTSTQPQRPQAAPGRPLLGQLLLDHGAVTAQQLEKALALQQERGQRLGELLCELGYLEAAPLRRALVEQAGIPPANLEHQEPDPQALTLVPAEVAMRHKVLPVCLTPVVPAPGSPGSPGSPGNVPGSTNGSAAGALRLAMADPFDRTTLEMMRVLTGRRIERCFCEETELAEFSRRFYGSSVARMIAHLDAPAGPDAIGATPNADGSVDSPDLATHLAELAREPSVVNLVNLIIIEAVEARASDVHVEPFEKSIKVKYRIDGVLHEMSPPPKRLEPAIISRLKIMAGMNIAERFVPQDGHIAFTAPRGKVDIRAATVPTVFGECMAMRILDRSAALISLEQLGMDEHTLAHFAALLDRPHGIVLVTGPTGSGKTTTLYAGLNRIYSPEIKLITIEDPVEYQLEGVNQIAVNRKRGIDFANGLRAILRQDPDVIMVGEIRDLETADIAIRSALTGHLVFSSLHTNDAPGAVTRLIDMGIEPFLLASSLEGVLAQRLVRTICPHCREPALPDEAVLLRLGHRAEDARKGRFFRGRGCRHCRQTGFFGRTAIFELLRVTEPVRRAVLQRGTAAEIGKAAPADHQPMIEDGFRKAATGATTLEEVLRATQDTQSIE